MPRQARLDIPGLVYHVMARGIEGCQIFRTNKDRDSFLARLAEIVTDAGGPTIYAWVLLPNHFHLLIRPAQIHLSTIMQRLMTGHAVNFNKVHKRVGHLFQNRYKSIVVEEDPYFLELVRYIHLNPLRANIIGTMKELKKYRYSGHSAIMGQRPCLFQAADDVLLRFGDNRSLASKAYEVFVEAGIEQGTREDLRGGGLIRSAGGVFALLARGSDAHEAADERILGSGDFVESVLHSLELEQRSGLHDVHEILAEIAGRSGLSEELILGPSKAQVVSKARIEFYERAQQEAGVSAAELGRITGRTHVAVIRALERTRVKRNKSQ
jgi:putative transposase